MVVDQRLLPRGEAKDKTGCLFSCDRCRKTYQESSEANGTFLFDRENRHIWCFNCVRPILSSTGACIGLERSTRLEYQSPPAESSRDDPAPTRQEAWKAREWDATWMCWDCAGGLYHHRPG